MILHTSERPDPSRFGAQRSPVFRSKNQEHVGRCALLGCREGWIEASWIFRAAAAAAKLKGPNRKTRGRQDRSIPREREICAFDPCEKGLELSETRKRRVCVLRVAHTYTSKSPSGKVF